MPSRSIIRTGVGPHREQGNRFPAMAAAINLLAARAARVQSRRNLSRSLSPKPDPSHSIPRFDRSRTGPYLTYAEREEIAILRAQRHGVRAIARRLERAPSTIARELRRNAAPRSAGLAPRATTAQGHADRSARRPKPAKLAVNAALQCYVQDRLAGRVVAPNGAAVHGPVVPGKGRRRGRWQDRRWAKAWSPEQIAHRLRLEFPDDETMRISHEAIYQALYVQGRGALRRELTACLR